jgi:hypothetical protein
VYGNVVDDLYRLVRSDETSNENKSLWERAKSWFRWKDTADSVMGSIAKLVPIIEPIMEFKDIYSNTRKPLDEL